MCAPWGTGLGLTASQREFVCCISLVLQLSEHVVSSFSISSPVEDFFPFHGWRFLQSSTILGGHQVSQLYAKLCWIITLFQLDFFTELKLASVFPGLISFSGVPFGQSMLSRQRIQFHCYWSLFTVLLVLLDMTISWVQQMWIQLPYFCCSLAFSVPLSSHKWSIKFKCKTILTVYLHNVSLHCWSLCCFLLTWCKAVSQGSRERDAKAKPTPFSGHLLLHCMHISTLLLL